MPRKLRKTDPIVLYLIGIRLQKKLTQKEVADQSRIALRTLQRIEQGKSDLTISQFRSLCDLYNVTSLDVSLGEMKKRQTSAADVAATAKLLPKRVREAFLNLMVVVGEELQKERG